MTTSSGERLSRYRSFGLQLPSLWNSITSIGSDLLNRLGPQN